MKPLHFRSAIVAATAFLGLTFGLTSCQDEDFGVDRAMVEHAAFLKSGLFDFSTSSMVKLSVDYCRPGVNNPVFVYDEYPYDEEGDLKPGVDPVFAFFLQDGAFDGALDLPTASRHLWLAAGGIGLPTLVEVEVQNGQATYVDVDTRTIVSNQYAYTYVQRDVLADLSQGGWTPRADCTVGTVTWHKGDKSVFERARDRNGEELVKFDDGMSWSVGLKTGSATDFASGSRYFSFSVDKPGTVKVYCRNAGDNGSRKVHISTAPNKDSGNIKGSSSGAVYSTTDIAKADVTAGDIYVWCDNNVIIYAITFTYETNNAKAGILSPADYTYKRGDLSGQITAAGAYDGWANHVYALYDWSVTGKPKVTDPALVNYVEGSSFDDMYYYWDSDGNPQYSGVKLYLKDEDITSSTTTAGTLQKYNFDCDIQYFDIKDGDSRITIDAPTAGKLYIYPDVWSAEKNFGFDGTQYALTETNTVRDVTAGTHYIHRPGRSYSIYNVLFEPNDNSATYRCVFTGDKLLNLKNDSKLGDGESGIFTLTKGTGSEFRQFNAQHSIDGHSDKGIRINDRWFAGNYSNKDRAYNFRFTLPANTKAQLIVDFQKDADDKNRQIVINGINHKAASNNTFEISSQGSPTEFIIGRGGALINVFGITVKYLDNYRHNTMTQGVKRFPQYDDEVLPTDWKLQAVTDRLENVLWHGEASKELAKKNKGGENFNQDLANSQQGDQCTTITNETGTKLYVTFMAEYNQRACNTLCYFVYPEGETPTDAKNIDLYTIFPNCTSTDYASSRTYKTDGDKDKPYFGSNESLVPLKNGDQVQIMYPNGDGTFSETFPKGVTVGWCLIYNGFDAWNASNNEIETSKIRLGVANNNHYSGYTTATSKVYYSIKSLNESEQPRCIAFTDPVTNQVSLTWEDSYNTDGHGSTEKDLTYDDVIFTVTATNNTDMETPGIDIPPVTPPTTISYTQKGIYLFEDIWNGNKTDFDMNDVAVKYKRIFTIGSDNKVKSVNETYTLMNDGATYDDGFAVRLPYTASQVASIQVKQKGGSLNTLDLNNTSITLDQNNRPRLENEEKPDHSDSFFNLVLFDNINLFSDADMQTMTWDVVITFKNDGIDINADQIDSEYKVIEGRFTFSRSAYNPFIIVYTDKTQNIGNNQRCEIHQPDQPLTSYGVADGADNVNNNRWNVARTNIAGGYMPFSIDVPNDNFVSPHEGTLITEAYTDFAEWATSKGTRKTDWYTKQPVDGKTGWDRVHEDAQIIIRQ